MNLYSNERIFDYKELNWRTIIMTLEELKRRKTEMGYTYAQIAKMSGIPLGTVQKIFTGETANPRYDTMQALEQLFEDPDMIQDDDNNFERGQGEYTVEDYYLIPSDQKVELIDGYFHQTTAPNFMHQDIASEIAYQIKKYIEANGLNCKAMLAPVDVKLDKDNMTMLQPDVVVLCDLDKRRKWGILGGPDFILEVTSSSSENKDYALKAGKYMTAKVREYWIIDPNKKLIVKYDFENNGEIIIKPLEENMALGIFEGALEIDFKKIIDIIDEFQKLDE